MNIRNLIPRLKQTALIRWLSDRALRRTPGFRPQLVAVSLLAVVGIGLRLSPFRVGMIVGDSMRPTLKPYQVFLMDTEYYKNHPPTKDDIVVFEWNGETCIKRVAAGPGQTLYMLDYVEDRRPMHLRYVISPREIERLKSMYWGYPNIVRVRKERVPNDRVFVVGDAQQNSLDSRYYGPIRVSQIIGRVRLPDVKPSEFSMGFQALATPRLVACAVGSKQ